MKAKLFAYIVLFTLATQVFAISPDKNKLKQDREAIKSMAGCYTVTFNFAETFAPDTAYKYHKRYHSEALEYVEILEETDNKIVLQHLLIIEGGSIIKHWRQDWMYENTELYDYDKDDRWVLRKLKPADVKGQWTQKVYQVDDSPRYEGTGTWIHADGKHYWESDADAPLPRREHTKRSDYNVLRRHNRMELTANGWNLEQDNKKIIRTTGKPDVLLCEEKGMESFTKGNLDCKAATDWWAENKGYWLNVRKAWATIFAQNPDLKINKLEDKMLWEALFKLGENPTKNPVNEQQIIDKIKAHLKKA